MVTIAAKITKVFWGIRNQASIITWRPMGRKCWRNCNRTRLNYLICNIVFCVVLLCVLTFFVPCCDVCYDFHIKTMFGSSLLPVVCRRVHVLFTLFVFVYVWWCPTHIVLCFLFCLSSSCVLYVASFSGFSFLDCPFGIL